MIKILLPLLLIAAAVTAISAAASNTEVNYYLTQNGTSGYTFDTKKPSDGSFDCHIFVNRTVNITGWDRVVVAPSRALLKKNASAAYYCGGLAEGYATGQSILDNAYNNNNMPDETTQKWLLANAAAMDKLGRERTDILMGQGVLRIFSHIHGMIAGVRKYQAEHKMAVTFGMLDAMLVVAWAEMDDIKLVAKHEAGGGGNNNNNNNNSKAMFQQGSSNNDKNVLPQTAEEEVAAASGTNVDSSTVASTASSSARDRLKASNFDLHCSAFIKVVDNAGAGNDVFFGHDSWRGFSGLLRQWKTYEWETSVSFSAFPGAFSIDDFIVTAHRLVIVETTIINYNSSILYHTTSNSVLEFVRLMTASTFATSGREFSEYFLKPWELASSTYCNSFMVLDMGLLGRTASAAGETSVGAFLDKKGRKALPDGTFTLLVQLANEYNRVEDRTDELRSIGQHGSFNIPEIEYSYKVSGNQAACAGGSLFCYEFGGKNNYNVSQNYSRAAIFLRDGPSVKDLASMQKMMRYNDYTKDPLSLIPKQLCGTGCNPAHNPQLSIACRADLAPKKDAPGAWGSQPEGLMKQNIQFMDNALFGAVDTKITASSMLLDGVTPRKTATASIISGPTTSHGLPAFSWKNHPDYKYRRGQVDTFTFPFVSVSYDISHAEASRWPVHASSSSKGTKLSVGAAVGIGFAVLVVIIALVFGVRSWKKKQLGGHTGGGYNEVEGVQDAGSRPYTNAV